MSHSKEALRSVICFIFREVPSSHRKVIPTAIRRVVGRGRDRLSVLQIVEEVRRTLAIQTFHPVPIDLSPTAGLERVVKEVGTTKL